VNVLSLYHGLKARGVIFTTCGSGETRSSVATETSRQEGRRNPYNAAWQMRYASTVGYDVPVT